MNRSDGITLRDVYAAQKRIAPFILATRLIQSEKLSVLYGHNVYLKMENEQVTRSFKVRGAANRLLQLSKAERDRGVVTVSTGNHGKAVAYIAAQLGVRAVVCVPEAVLHHKMEAMRSLGAEVIVRGSDQEEAEVFAEELAAEQGLTLVSPFDDPDIIAGQGTIALEIAEALPDVSTVVVPLSGGGLLSGIALAIKHIHRDIRTVAVSMDRSPVMYWSLRAGHPLHLPELPTLADSLMGGFGAENRYTFDIVRRYVDEAVLVSESEIAESMEYAFAEEGIVVEGGGAVGIAAIRSDKLSMHHSNGPRENVVIVVSGGNADMEVLRRLLAGSDRAAS